MAIIPGSSLLLILVYKKEKCIYREYRHYNVMDLLMCLAENKF